MLARQFQSESGHPSASLPGGTAPPPAFPGLVSSLRPIRRLTAQVADEAALLRRFTYKHNNQHKGQGWWRRIVHVDRVTHRALDEIHGWLADFGVSTTAAKDDVGPLTREVVCAGLIRLPRVMLVVETSLKVLRSTAGILEQLVECRAFLAFAVVVVALSARLHALFSGLYDEGARTAATLLRLVESNQLSSAVTPKISILPRTLRRFISLDTPVVSSSNPASQSATPRDSIVPDASLDELGAAVERGPIVTARPAGVQRSLSGTPSVPPSRERALVGRETPIVEANPGPVPPLPASQKRKAKRTMGTDVAPRSAESASSASLPFAYDGSEQSASIDAKPARPGMSKPGKRPQSEAASEQAVQGRPAAPRAMPGAGLVNAAESPDDSVKKVKKVKKKKVKVGAGGDEIDAIFG